MLKLQMLPAGCGDCLWLEYGTPPATHVVIIDGGVGKTVKALNDRIEMACRERGQTTLDVELLVVTHIDNDHIMGIIELLKAKPSFLKVKEVWFNGLPQLKSLPAPASLETQFEQRERRSRPADLLGDSDGDEDLEESESLDNFIALPSPGDLLGRQQSDDLTQLLTSSGLSWNVSWDGKAVMIPDTGALPTKTLAGKLTLTLLGPPLARLYKLCTVWPDVLGGDDDQSALPAALPDDLLGPRDTWPPVWKEGEQRDSSSANGSSIMLLAEYKEHKLLLAGDGYAPDIAAALERLSRERNIQSSFPIHAFKLPHHASAHNLSRAVLDRIDCCRYLISTDGSGRPKHPDHQALLRILRYSRKRPQLFFNYLGDTTRPWRDMKAEVVSAGFQDYDTSFPKTPAEGLILELE